MSTCDACNGKGYYQPPRPPIADKYLYQPMPRDRPMHTGDRIKELEEEVDNMHEVIYWLVECCERWPCDVCNGTGVIEEKPIPVEGRTLEL